MPHKSPTKLSTECDAVAQKFCPEQRPRLKINTKITGSTSIMDLPTSNLITYSVVAGLDFVVGVAIIAVIVFSDITRFWTALAKLAMLVVALGIIGQSLALINGVRMTDPIYYQIWILKDVGIAIWVLSLCGQWIDEWWAERKSDSEL